MNQQLTCQLYCFCPVIASFKKGVFESLENPDFIMVMDRAYGKLERLDRYKQDGQFFVVRLRDNVLHIEKPYALRRQVVPDSSVIGYTTCRLGTPQCRSKQRHRVVIFRDFEGREIRVVTDLMGLAAEQIALIYKSRWQIEVFFRWIKQHLKLSYLIWYDRKCRLWSTLLRIDRLCDLSSIPSSYIFLICRSVFCSFSSFEMVSWKYSYLCKNVCFFTKCPTE